MLDASTSGKVCTHSLHRHTAPNSECMVAAAAAPAGGTMGDRMSEREKGGTKPSVAPAPADGGDGGGRRLQVGDRVFARYRRDRQYYPGVRRVHPPAQRGNHAAGSAQHYALHVCVCVCCMDGAGRTLLGPFSHVVQVCVSARALSGTYLFARASSPVISMRLHTRESSFITEGPRRRPVENCLERRRQR